jgi:hypothetical protein
MINTGKTYKSLEEALMVLNTSYIKKDEHIELHYKSGENMIDVLVAIGTKDGIGPGSYSILSTQSIQIVNIVSELPDASELKNGQLYIWTGSDDLIIYKVYLSKNKRMVEPVEVDMLAQDRNGVKYYINRKAVRKFSDFITSSEVLETGHTWFLTLSEYEALPLSVRAAQGNVFVIVTKQQ